MLKNKKVAVVLSIFLAFCVWWPLLHFGHRENTNHILDWFAATYGIVALLGGLWGISISKKWGGGKSIIGRAVLMFSIGLLAQEFGQLAYAYYAIVKVVEVPYPSFGDIGYFGSVLFYIYGAILLTKAVGVKFSLKKLGNKALALLLPLLLLVTSYLFFLRDYQANWHHPLTVLLDFGYPLGQAIYIAIAILAFVLSRKLLGGVMRSKILFIIFALCAQYAADFNFLYQASKTTWITAGYGDMLYLLSYMVMTLALLNISVQSLKIQQRAAEASQG